MGTGGKIPLARRQHFGAGHRTTDWRHGMDAHSEQVRDWVSAGEAATLARVSISCVHKWTKRYEIGRKVAGRWRVERATLDRIIAGELPPPRKKGPRNSNAARTS